MTRTDHAVVGGLVLLLALIASAIAVPAFLPAQTASGAGTPDPGEVEPYREGVLGRAVSVSPLSARTQVDRDLVALSFSGLVRLGADGALLPDLAERWTADADGRGWTFILRRDIRWHDGQPVTADDVVFTIQTLNDPAYTGPGAGSWREVTVRELDERTVQFDLATPLGGFLSLARQPIAPAHLLADVPVEQLADDPFGQLPVGSGPWAVVELDESGAVLEPAAEVAAPANPDGGPGPLPTDSLATPGPTSRPAGAVPYLERIELEFHDDPADLVEAFEAGRIDAVSGLSAADAKALAEAPDARLLRYPGTTLTTVALNLRPDHPAFRDSRVRTALLAAIDRKGAIDLVVDGQGTVADAPIPPTSWAFDQASSTPVNYDPKAAAALLTDAGWKLVDGKWRAPGGKAPLTINVLSPNADMSPTLAALADKVAADWQALGLDAKRTTLEPGAMVAQKLQAGEFDAAVFDIAVGHDPDLYPLLASSQTRTGGFNVIGYQDPALDKLLAAARGAAADDVRASAYAALQAELAKSRPLLPIAFADELVVVRDSVNGQEVQPVADPSDRFWDVLTWRLAADR